MTQPIDLIVLQTEIQRLRVDIIAARAALVKLPKTTLMVPVVDIFALEEQPWPSHWKRPHKDDDPDVIRVHVRLT